MLEQENGGLYGFSDDERNRQNYVPVIVNEPAIETTVPSDPFHATGSILTAPDSLEHFQQRTQGEGWGGGANPKWGFQQQRSFRARSGAQLPGLARAPARGQSDISAL
ncbi:unnamed protein product [Prunus armeniaca]